MGVIETSQSPKNSLGISKGDQFGVQSDLCGDCQIRNWTFAAMYTWFTDGKNIF